MLLKPKRTILRILSSGSIAAFLEAIIYLASRLLGKSREPLFHGRSKMNLEASGLLLLPGKNLAVSPRRSLTPLYAGINLLNLSEFLRGTGFRCPCGPRRHCSHLWRRRRRALPATFLTPQNGVGVRKFLCSDIKSEQRLPCPLGHFYYIRNKRYCQEYKKAPNGMISIGACGERWKIIYMNICTIQPARRAAAGFSNIAMPARMISVSMVVSSRSFLC